MGRVKENESKVSKPKEYKSTRLGVKECSYNNTMEMYE